MRDCIGIGPVTAYKLIKEHKNIEKIIEKLEEDNKLGNRKRQWNIPVPFYYQDARELFKNPDVISDYSQVEVTFLKYRFVNH